jgi:fucose 4-O-acetylase-like acetyltransferase
MNEKLYYITKAQTIAVSLVVLGHSVLTDVPSASCFAQWTHSFIYSFHMPLFIFISGFLFMYSSTTRNIRYREFMIRKVKRILIPYIFISTAAFFSNFYLLFRQNLLKKRCRY